MAGVLRSLLDEIIERRQQEILHDDPIWQVIGVAQEVEGPTTSATMLTAICMANH